MKAYKRLSILCIAVLLCALLPVLAGATSPGDPPEAVDPNASVLMAGTMEQARKKIPMPLWQRRWRRRRKKIPQPSMSCPT